MARQTTDNKTLDILDWEPPKNIVPRFEEKILRALTLRSRISHAVSETLRESKLKREEVAEMMSSWLEEEVSKNMLDNYASEGRDEHTIPYIRLLALVQVTQDTRLLQVGAELFQHSVIDDQYLDWIEVGQLADKKKEIDNALSAKRRLARSRSGK